MAKQVYFDSIVIPYGGNAPFNFVYFNQYKQIEYKEWIHKNSGQISDDSCCITFENHFTSVIDCLFYNKHVLKCEHVLTVNC